MSAPVCAWGCGHRLAHALWLDGEHYASFCERCWDAIIGQVAADLFAEMLRVSLERSNGVAVKDLIKVLNAVRANSRGLDVKAGETEGVKDADDP